MSEAVKVHLSLRQLAKVLGQEHFNIHQLVAGMDEVAAEYGLSSAQYFGAEVNAAIQAQYYFDLYYPHEEVQS